MQKGLLPHAPTPQKLYFYSICCRDSLARLHEQIVLPPHVVIGLALTLSAAQYESPCFGPHAVILMQKVPLL